MNKPIKLTLKVFIVAAVVLLVLSILSAYWVATNLTFARIPVSDVQQTLGSQTVLARVSAITDAGQITLGDHTQNYQTLDIEILQGKSKGLHFSMDYGKVQLRSDDFNFKVGDRIYVTQGTAPDGTVRVYYADFDRSKALIILALVFLLSILVMGRWKGLGSLVSLGISMFMIISYIIPHILAGDDPVRVSIIGSVILMAVTLYLTYGWNLKTHSSVLSMGLSLLLTGGLAALFVTFSRLNGYGDENALYLIQLSSVQINPQGLLLGGIIIGTLGVLDDLVTSQSAAVVEIHNANPNLNFFETFKRAINIGQDHVAATVNTLVLSYTGASLPLLLVFTLGNGGYQYLFNSEILAEEIVRTLVGSIGLVAAVPISTLIATLIIVNQHRLDRLGEWRVLLGAGTESEGGEEWHHHH
ncbi:MAG: YibE/F family protein [Anaerolineaceae bacterium]|nr:YibE/F family protein [Anaerolineaceae bacterium]